MGHIALYREWRPKTFDEVVEQEYTVAALRQAVLSGSIAHAYLFSGTRGTGKTTMAQIFSRAINCLSPENGSPCNKCSICTGILDGSLLDVIEMDAASNNNVDTIRRLCDEIIFAPSVARFKVYIIDEVHMLSAGAFNALLKTLEEPPAHAVFILATTEQHRIPATILSRCQRYEFRRIPVRSIVERLGLIARTEGVEADPDALQLIARLADGALRDAISLFDQARGSFPGAISAANVLSLVGMVNDDFMHDVALSILERSPARILFHIENLVMDGKDVMRFSIDLVSFFRSVMVILAAPDAEGLLGLSGPSIGSVRDIASRTSLPDVIRIIRDLSSLSSELKWSLNPRVTLEAALIRLMAPESIPATSPVPAPAAPAPSRTAAPPASRPAAPQHPRPDPDTPRSTQPASHPEPDRAAMPAAEPVTDLPGAEIKSDRSEPGPSAVLSTDPAAEPGREDPTSGSDISLLWPKILDQVVASGQMTCYLFLLPGRPTISGNTILITFDEKDEVNCREISTDKNAGIIRKAAQVVTGTDYSVRTVLAGNSRDSGTVPPAAAGSDASAGEAAQTPLSGIEALRRSAGELGIAFYMEE